MANEIKFARLWIAFPKPALVTFDAQFPWTSFKFSLICLWCFIDFIDFINFQVLGWARRVWLARPADDVQINEINEIDENSMINQ